MLEKPRNKLRKFNKFGNFECKKVFELLCTYFKLSNKLLLLTSD